ncbi:MAG: CopG family transcriptional regulator [Actinobacteria bacterium]|nr:CopG family transcriptional regulator [Actinomycetota bacterium]
MVRMQIQFTEEEDVALRREAAQRHVSVSAVVRKAVDDGLAASAKPSREELVRRSLAAMGRFHSGTGDVSARHDEYFADSILD